MSLEPPFLRSVSLMRDRIEDPTVYPFSLPAVEALDGLKLSAVTYFIGENGSGKSTILEALAVASGFNAEGGSINFKFAMRRSESPLHECIRIARAPKRPRTGFSKHSRPTSLLADLPPAPDECLVLGLDAARQHP